MAGATLAALSAAAANSAAAGGAAAAGAGTAAGLGAGTAAGLGAGTAAGLGAGALGAGATGAALGADAAGTAGALGAGMTPMAMMPAATGVSSMLTSAPLATLPATAAPATSGITSAILQSLGGMGPAQANALAAQTADFGPAGLNATLQAASPTYDMMTTGLGLLGKGMNTYGKVENAMSMLQPHQQAPMAVARPPSMSNPQNFNQQPLAPPIGSRPGMPPPADGRALLLKRLGLLGGY